MRHRTFESEPHRDRTFKPHAQNSLHHLQCTRCTASRTDRVTPASPSCIAHHFALFRNSASIPQQVSELPTVNPRLWNRKTPSSRIYSLKYRRFARCRELTQRHKNRPIRKTAHRRKGMRSNSTCVSFRHGCATASDRDRLRDGNTIKYIIGIRWVSARNHSYPILIQ